MKQTFLFVLYKHKPFYFGLAVLFISFQAFFSYKGIETLPFFNYGMYSKPIHEEQTNYTTVFAYNQQTNQKINFSPFHYSPTFIQYQLNYYNKLIQQDSIDGTLLTIENRFGQNNFISKHLGALLTNKRIDIKKMPLWFSKYIENDICISRENFEWVKCNLRKVKSKKLY